MPKRRARKCRLSGFDKDDDLMWERRTTALHCKYKVVVVPIKYEEVNRMQALQALLPTTCY